MSVYKNIDEAIVAEDWNVVKDMLIEVCDILDYGYVCNQLGKRGDLDLLDSNYEDEYMACKEDVYVEGISAGSIARGAISGDKKDVFRWIVEQNML